MRLHMQDGFVILASAPYSQERGQFAHRVCLS